MGGGLLHLRYISFSYTAQMRQDQSTVFAEVNQDMHIRI